MPPTQTCFPGTSRGRGFQSQAPVQLPFAIPEVAQPETQRHRDTRANTIQAPFLRQLQLSVGLVRQAPARTPLGNAEQSVVLRCAQESPPLLKTIVVQIRQQFFSARG